MATHAEALQVGLALVVQGSVRVQSTNGVTRVIEPNSEIYLDDRIETGSSGAVSIVLGYAEGAQLDLGRMSHMIVDEDVMGGTLPDLGDVALEAELAADLLQNWESFAPIAALNTFTSETEERDVEEAASAESIPGLKVSSSTVAATDTIDDGVGTIDEDLDMTNFIPPPEDGS